MFEHLNNRQISALPQSFFKRHLLKNQILSLLTIENGFTETQNKALIGVITQICQECSIPELESGFLRLKDLFIFIEKFKEDKTFILDTFQDRHFAQLKSFFYTDFNQIIFNAYRLKPNNQIPSNEDIQPNTLLLYLNGENLECAFLHPASRTIQRMEIQEDCLCLDEIKINIKQKRPLSIKQEKAIFDFLTSESCPLPTYVPEKASEYFYVYFAALANNIPLLKQYFKYLREAPPIHAFSICSACKDIMLQDDMPLLPFVKESTYEYILVAADFVCKQNNQLNTLSYLQAGFNVNVVPCQSYYTENLEEDFLVHLAHNEAFNLEIQALICLIQQGASSINELETYIEERTKDHKLKIAQETIEFAQEKLIDQKIIEFLKKELNNQNVSSMTFQKV